MPIAGWLISRSCRPSNCRCAECFRTIPASNRTRLVEAWPQPKDWIVPWPTMWTMLVSIRPSHGERWTTGSHATLTGAASPCAQSHGKIGMSYPVRWMVWISRPAVVIDLVGITVQIDAPLWFVVTVKEERLQLAEPKLGPVAIVRHDVVGDFGRRDDAALQAHSAQRLVLELQLATAKPERCPVEMLPLRPGRGLVHHERTIRTARTRRRPRPRPRPRRS